MTFWYFFLFFSENKLWHFMQIDFSGQFAWNVSLFSWEKKKRFQKSVSKKNINLSSGSSDKSLLANADAVHLMFSMLGKIFSRQNFEIVFLAYQSPRLRRSLYDRQWYVVRRQCRQHFQTASPLKPLGQLKPNYVWSLYGVGKNL